MQTRVEAVEAASAVARLQALEEGAGQAELTVPHNAAPNERHGGQRTQEQPAPERDS